MAYNQVASFEIKSQLARLLSTENITVRHSPSARTASFDIKHRILTLPVWQNISEDLYDLLVVHETGHAIDTPLDEWIAAIKMIATKCHAESATATKAEGAVKNFLNVVDDARIDKRQKRRYPGSKRNYLVGYKELLDRNFFGINGKEINSLPFIDRLNLHFKTSGLLINFSAAEKALVKKVSETETFDEVVAVTEEVYRFSIAEAQNKKSQTVQDDNEFFAEDEGDETFDSGNDEEIDDILSISDEDFGDEESGDEDEVVDGDETRGSGVGEQNDDDESDEDVIPESITEEAAQKALESIVRDDDTNYYYVTLPKINYENVVQDHKIVIPEMDQAVRRMFDEGYIKSDLAKLVEWKTKEKDSISFMVKEFETRKAADQYSRVAVAKTGLLDQTKLHSYKYNDDIFRKLALVPDGKNHGFVMVLDWSGSMLATLEHTLKQLFSLVLFCKRVQIPFEVFLFRSTFSSESYGKTSFNFVENNIMMEDFRLRNILSSRMNAATLNKAMECLWIARTRGISSDPLDSTPLNQAILALDKIVNDFRKTTKVQIVNTIILTDGQSDPLRGVFAIKTQPAKPNGNLFILRDDVTGITYSSRMNVGTWYNEATQVFLKILRARTNTTLIGFFMHSGPLSKLSRVSSAVDYNFTQNVDNQKFWKENKYIGLTNAGYDEYFVVSCPSKWDTQIENTLDVSSSMTKAKALKAFIKFNEKKAINRVMLTKFITHISKKSAA